MTIAACYLTPEGVVLGADSTVSYYFPDQKGQLTPHYFNSGQKVFEIGEGSTLGITMWGLAAAGLKSHRTLIAELADDLNTTPATSVQQCAERWVERFWRAYSAAGAAQITRARQLASQPTRTPAEEEELVGLDALACGFCVGGRVESSREPSAYEMIFTPRLGKAPKPIAIPFGWKFWGAPNAIQRLIFGLDDAMVATILKSGKWTGTEQELRALMYPGQDFVPPLREAIDFVHSAIYTTIKSLKFSKLHQICGGPVEIAVISTDRKFRWVRHKLLGDAISLSEGDNVYQA